MGAFPCTCGHELADHLAVAASLGSPELGTLLVCVEYDCPCCEYESVDEADAEEL